MASSPASSYDCSFKVLLIGDSAVGKSSLLVSFVSAAHIDDDIAPTIGTCASASPISRWISPLCDFYANYQVWRLPYTTAIDFCFLS
jgi:hypothetical protein